MSVVCWVSSMKIMLNFCTNASNKANSDTKSINAAALLRWVWFAGCPRYPIVVDAQAENCRLHVQGWRTNTGLLLQQPISMSLNFTPAFVK